MSRQAARAFTAGERFPDSRRATRYPITARSEVIEPVGNKYVVGCVTVISVTGCYFRTVDTFEAATLLKLRIEWRGARFQTWARVAHSIPGDGMGLAFFDTDPSTMELLKKWTDELAAADAKG
jgi:hypothetical protein